MNFRNNVILNQNHYQHSPEYITELIGMNGCGDLQKLAMNGKPYDMLLRKEPFNADNEKRSKVTTKATWNDKAIVCKLKHNAAFQTIETQVLDFAKAIKGYMLNKTFRSILIDAMQSGMNSQKLVKSLEKDDADYWKMLKAVDPMANKLDSLDEILCDEGIKCLMRSLLNAELKEPFDDLENDIKLAMYKSGDFPTEIECMFTED